MGEQETLILHLAQESGAEALAQALRVALQVPVSASDGTLLLNVPSATALLSEVLAQAAALQLSVRNIEIREPNLETLFLNLTGRALRD